MSDELQELRDRVDYLERKNKELAAELKEAEEMYEEADEERLSLRRDVEGYETTHRRYESERQMALLHARQMLEKMTAPTPYEQVMNERAIEILEELTS